MTTDTEQLEAYLRLMAETLSSSRKAADAFKQLSTSNASLQAWQGWFEHFMPDTIPNTMLNNAMAKGSTFSSAKSDSANNMMSNNMALQADIMSKWLLVYWKQLGFVPQTDYDALKQNYEEVSDKLNKTEAMVQALRQRLMVLEQTEQGQKLLSQWQEGLNTSLEMQQAWWQSLLDSAKEDPVKKEE